MVMRLFLSSIRFLACSAFLLTIPYGITSAEPQAGGDDFDVRVLLYRPPDGPEQTANALQVGFQIATVGEDTHSIQDLLKQSHIWPTADAFGLVYALNPDLPSASPLQPGAKLRFLTINPSAEIAKLASDGFWVKVRYDDRLINEIVAARETLTVLAARTAALPAERFSNPDTTRRCISDGSKDFWSITAALQRRDQPLDHEMLSQVRGDEAVLSDMLQRTLAAGSASMAAGDEETICSLTKDLRLKQETFGGVRGSAAFSEKFPTVRVLVNTVNPETGNPVSGLTVHYVQEAMKGRPEYEKSLGGLSSPSTERIPEADYYFWATRQSAVVTEPKKCFIRQDGDKPYRCDLPVKP
jgi:hypothetical protein